MSSVVRQNGRLLLRQQFLDLRPDGRRRRRRGVTLDDVPLLIYQKLGEVPLDTVSEQAALFAFQELEERMRILAVDLDLREEGKAHAVVDLAKRLDLVVRAGLLVTELVAGETEHL